MKLTNYLDLPQPLYDAVKNDPYDKGDADYSITGLLAPPRLRRLLEIHDAELSEDVADRLDSLEGQIVHGIFERAEREAWAEPRLYAEVAGKRISGQIDRLHLEGTRIEDYKNTSIWKTAKGLPREWEEQVNGYIYLAHANGYEVTSARAVVRYRDWKKRAARRQAGYPPHKAAVFEIPVWSDDRTYAFLVERIRLHEAARIELPLCTPSETWDKPDEYAVYQGAGKRAVRVYQTMKEAEEHVRAFGDGYRVETRPGEKRIRCQDFCLLADAGLCEQWIRERQNGNG